MVLLVFVQTLILVTCVFQLKSSIIGSPIMNLIFQHFEELYPL